MTHDEAATLLDDMTPVYRHRMARLPYWERRVLACLAYMPQPSRAKAIHQNARMLSQAASMCLTRLKRKGHVKHAGRSQWRVADPWLWAWLNWRRRGSFDIPDAEPPTRPSLWDQLVMAEMEAVRRMPGASK